MKILNWRIYSNKRVGKIIKLIGTIAEDRELAKELLLGNQEQKDSDYPRYRLKIDSIRVTLERQQVSYREWSAVDHSYYSFGNEDSKASSIQVMKNNIEKRRKNDKIEYEKSQFKEYTINL